MDQRFENERRPVLSLVVPTLDESESIGPVLREVGDALRSLDVEIIVVDDSPDTRTAAVVQAHAARDPRIRLIRRVGERGLASAAIAGFSAARAPLLGLMDGDGQHDPALIVQMTATMADPSCDFAVASRYASACPSGLSAIRHTMSRAATTLTRRLLGAPTTDPLSGLFLVRREWFEAACSKLSGVGFKILIDLIWSGPRAPRIAEVPSSLRRRHGGASKLDLRVAAELAALLIEKRSAGLVSARFALFAQVGASGVLVHLCALAAAQAAGLREFWLAQAFAIWVAMTWNFEINNALTFRDLRLSGRARLRGLLSFYIACAGGALISETIGAGLNALGLPALIAASCGIAAAAVWNYASVKRRTWSAAATARDGAVPDWREARPR